MTNPQLEDGYTRLANDLLDAMMRLDLNGSDWTILLTIIRHTYGWNKKEDCISYSQFQRQTGLTHKGVAIALKALRAHRVITAVTNGQHITYQLQKDFTQWVPLRQEGKLVSTGTPVYNSTLVSTGTPELVSTGTHTKDNKDNKDRVTPSNSSNLTVAQVLEINAKRWMEASNG